MKILIDMQHFAETLRQECPQWIQETVWSRGELTVRVAPEYIVPFMTYLRDHSQTQFKCLIDVTAVDYPDRDLRFRIVYHLLSVEYASRIRVSTDISETQPLASVTPIFSSADGGNEKFGICLVYFSKVILIYVVF